jgi:hypothetical protein
VSARQQLEAKVRRYALWATVVDGCAALLAGGGAAMCAQAAMLLDGQPASASLWLVVGAAGALAVWLERAEKRQSFARRLDARCGCQGALTATLDAPAGRMAEALAAQVLPQLTPRAVWRVVASALPLALVLVCVSGIGWLAAYEARAGQGAGPNPEGRAQAGLPGANAARQLQALRAAAGELRQAALTTSTASSAAARTALAQAALAAERLASALEQADPAQAAAARADVRTALDAAALELATEESPGQPLAKTLERARRTFGLEKPSTSGSSASGSNTGVADESASTSSAVGSGTLASRGADGTISTPLNAAGPPIVPVPPEFLPRQDAEWIARWLERVRSP